MFWDNRNSAWIINLVELNDMRIGDTYICDICQKQFIGQDAVEDSVSIDNREHSGHYAQVCRKCIKVIGGAIDSLKPQIN